jgi:hypothetical protein
MIEVIVIESQFLYLSMPLCSEEMTWIKKSVLVLIIAVFCVQCFSGAFFALSPTQGISKDFDFLRKQNLSKSLFDTAIEEEIGEDEVEEVDLVFLADFSDITLLISLHHSTCRERIGEARIDFFEPKSGYQILLI